MLKMLILKDSLYRDMTVVLIMSTIRAFCTIISALLSIVIILEMIDLGEELNYYKFADDSVSIKFMKSNHKVRYLEIQFESSYLEVLFECDVIWIREGTE